MLKKFAEAIRLLFANLALFSAIILTVWLPGNVLINYLLDQASTDEQVWRTLRVSTWIDSIFGPIYIGAMIHALAQLKKAGRRPRYREAMAVGFRNWGRLFGARFVAHFLIGIGFIALVIPGIVLAVRYALLDPAVVLEGAGPGGSRRRSTELTVGVRWQIFWAGVIFFVGAAIVEVAISLLMECLPQPIMLPAAVVLGCVQDVLMGTLQIVLFLYYWQAVAREGREIEESASHGLYDGELPAFLG